MDENGLDTSKRKDLAREEWQKAAPGWHKWIHVLSELSKDITEQMLDAAGVGTGMRVLDIAAGDGDQSMAAARRVGPEGGVLATDISSNLLEYAAATAKENGLDNIETRLMDAEDLDLENDTFDAVISRYGLMLLPDIHKAMLEINRVLKPGSRLGAVVFSTPDKTPWVSMSAKIAMEHANLPPPKPGQPGFFSLGAPGVLENVFEKAGFQEIETSVVSVPFKMASAAECAQYLYDIAGALHMMLSSLDEEGKKAAWTAIEQGLTQFENEDGFVSPMEVVIGGGRKV